LEQAIPEQASEQASEQAHEQASKQATESRGGTRGRSRLWEIWHKYHCPIIGTCLEVDDLRRLARKAGVRLLRDARSDFDVHVSFVAAADEKNPLSIAVQKELERRYARSVKRFAAATSTAALLELWQQAVAEGEVQGAFWAVMTHGLADVEVRTRAFEDVHMLSHQIGAGLRADLAALTALQQGKRPLLLCFNRPLAERLRYLVKPGGWVDTWYGFCDHFLQTQGIQLDYASMSGN
ncbi:hypothetical protein U5801_27715, partial [Lamprobacter modestohalophilus]|nr:hypothetical protein [Lamprobacter modestohalophilus]